MIKCPNCENENRDGAKFCYKCRTPLPVVVPVQPVALQGATEQVTPPPISPPPLTPPPIAAMQAMPGEPDMTQLLAMLPDLDIKTTDLQIPLPDVDISAEIERLTQFNLDEQVRLIQQLERHIKAGQSRPDQS